MAENDTLKEAAKLLEDLKSKLQQQTITVAEADEVWKSHLQTYKLTAEQTNKLSKSFDTVKDSVTKLINIPVDKLLDNINKGLSEMRQKAADLVPNLNNLGEIAYTLPPALNRLSVPDSFTHLASNIDAARDASGQLRPALDSIFKSMPTLARIPGFQDWLNKMSSFAESARSMEMGIIGMASATGNLNSLLGPTGEGVNNLSTKAEAFSDRISRMASATGFSNSQIAAFSSTLGKEIPNAMDDFDNRGEGVRQRITKIEAAMRVASGTGQSLATVSQNLVKIYNSLGIEGEPALAFMARMQAASDAIGLPLSRVQEFAQDAAKGFAMYANDMKAAANIADGTINIMGQLAPALKASGLGPEAINNVVGGVTAGLKNLSTAQKAFLSSQTGGPGGLQGAFQIDQMISEGKIDQVYGKVKENMMKQLGGPIVTRAQAADSPEAAAQFQKQIMFMRSGPMGALAQDDASAVKLLEAMAGGKKADIKDKDIVLRETMQRGTVIQERNNDVLKQIKAGIDRQNELAALANASFLRKTVGNQNAGVNDLMREYQQESKKPAKTGMFNKERGREVKDVVAQTNILEEVNKAGRRAERIATGFVDSMKNEYNGIDRTSPAKLGVNPSSLTKGVRAVQEKQAGQHPSKSQPVQVSVTTVCSVCQRKVASEEAHKAIAHNHQNQNGKNFAGTAP